MDNGIGEGPQASTRQGTLQMEEASQEHSYPPSQSTSTDQANDVDSDLASGDGSGGNPTPESDTNTERPLLLVPLTGYVLLTISTVVAFATSKGVLALKGQSVAPNVLDLASVLVGGVILWFIGLFERVTPPIAPWFFHEDLTIDVLYFPLHFIICALPCGCLSVLMLAAHVNAVALTELESYYTSIPLIVLLAAVIVMLGYYGYDHIWLDFLLPRLIMRGRILARVYRGYRVRLRIHSIAYLLSAAVIQWVCMMSLVFAYEFGHMPVPVIQNLAKFLLFPGLQFPHTCYIVPLDKYSSVNMSPTGAIGDIT